MLQAPIRAISGLPLLEQVCDKAHLGPVRRHRRCVGGTTHVVYQVITSRGRFAIRAGPVEEASQTWQQKVRFADLHLAPCLLYEGTAFLGEQAYSYSVSEWLDGRPLDYRRDLRRLAATLAFLHRRTRGLCLAPAVAGDLGGYIREQLTRYVRNRVGGGRIAECLRRAAATELSALAQDREADQGLRCLVHNDLVRRNIIIVSDRARLIDWDWAMNAHPALDLCGFLSPFVTSWDRERGLSDRAMAIFLNCYSGSFSRTDARAVRRSLICSWSGYNAMVANWLYYESGGSQPHLRAIGFYRRAFGRVQEVGAWLQKWTGE